MTDRDADHTKTPSAGKMAGNTIWNLLGMGLPAVIGLISIPILVSGGHIGSFVFEGLGKAKFGAMGLVWVFVGYFSIFDMGLGRALTKLVAEKLSLRKESEIPALFWTAISMMFMFGLIATLILAGLAPALAGHWLKLPDVLRHEAMIALFIVAMGMPIVVMCVGLIGVLEACRKFKMINAIRFPAGAFTFIGPVCALPFTNNLIVVVSVLIIGRILEMLSYFLCCLIVLPTIRHSFKYDKTLVRPLLHFGGWMTVSNMAVPLMMHVNRLLIDLIRSVAIGSYYLIAEEVMVRLFIFPRALISVWFPALVGALTRSRQEASELFERGCIYLMLAMFPVILVLYIVIPEGITLWLGADFAANSTVIVQIMSVGVLLHSIARMPWFLIQAAGRPGISACIHAVEVPIYLAGAWFLIGRYGIRGAAIVWTIRMFIDCVAMFIASRQFLVNLGEIALKMVALITGILGVYGMVMLNNVLMNRILIGIIGGIVFYILSWLFVLSARDRSELIDMVKKITSPIFS